MSNRISNFRTIEYYTLYSGALLLSRLPLAVLYLFSDLGFYLIYHVLRYRRAVVIQNFSRAFPEMKYLEIQLLSKLFYRQFTDYFIEIIKMFSSNSIQIQKELVFKNMELIDDYTNKGKNVIVALGHCGNWEKVIATPLVVGSTIYSAYKPLKNKSVDRIMRKARSRFWMS